ncbi:lactoylglutathione lyase [Carnobacterium alterfunditum]|uniref:Lactoylglutathione lyase n=1 Tax=Carnobacterium alterfunditum TaxID=28230 RepID=A0A1N6EKT5_9LACT|nr:VOC family protein [Carnobacterium alterfunditum]SIN83595.1 lactoylglutathione lyase [Carnobacterium alterfunditum]
MKISHVALWSKDIERMRQFYETYFNAQAGERYENTNRGFASYFLTFPGAETKLELMQQPTITDQPEETPLGWAHLAISVGSEKEVNNLTTVIAGEGHTIVGQSRWTGDGYYESVVADPEGNLIEITI